MKLIMTIEQGRLRIIAETLTLSNEKVEVVVNFPVSVPHLPGGIEGRSGQPPSEKV